MLPVGPVKGSPRVSQNGSVFRFLKLHGSHSAIFSAQIRAQFGRSES